MRLWSLHPRYLDRAGLVALWREALLAQAVLRGDPGLPPAPAVGPFPDTTRIPKERSPPIWRRSAGRRRDAVTDFNAMKIGRRAQNATFP